MVEKFSNVFYLIIYLVHFGIVGIYAYQLVFDTKNFLKGRGVDKSATLLTRFGGSFMVATVIMAIYVAFIRTGGGGTTEKEKKKKNLIIFIWIRWGICPDVRSFQ